jgi:hypothetical protein
MSTNSVIVFGWRYSVKRVWRFPTVHLLRLLTWREVYWLLGGVVSVEQRETLCAVREPFQALCSQHLAVHTDWR